MHEAIYTKYIMLKKFQNAMLMMAVAELAILINVDNSIHNYWLRLLVREWAQFSIISYIGWTFRSKDLAPRFSVMPVIKSIGERMVPPIYSIEMDATTFKDFSSHGWHIGVPTSSKKGSLKSSVLVVVQHPHMCRLTPLDTHSHRVAQLLMLQMYIIQLLPIGTEASFRTCGRSTSIYYRSSITTSIFCKSLYTFLLRKPKKFSAVNCTLVPGYCLLQESIFGGRKAFALLQTHRPSSLQLCSFLFSLLLFQFL